MKSPALPSPDEPEPESRTDATCPGRRGGERPDRPAGPDRWSGDVPRRVPRHREPADPDRVARPARDVRRLAGLLARAVDREAPARAEGPLRALHVRRDAPRALVGSGDDRSGRRQLL